MLPSSIRGDTKSAAERFLFGQFRQGLSDDWVVLHSLGLTNHPRKPWAEIDFVVVGPLGVFCIEVKGGRVSREGGKWLFTDRNGRVAAKSQGPFEQVGPASAALRQRLVDRYPALSRTLVGYGVATPDIRFAIKGPDVLPEVVFDQGDALRPVAEYVNRLASYWQDRLRGGRQEITSQQVLHIVDYLRGDFDLRRSLGSIVREVKDDLISLTAQQFVVLRTFEDSERVVVRGGAGTGKTLLAAEEAARWTEDEGARVLLTCFNRNLARFLKETMSRRSPRVRVQHFHAFLHDLIEEAGLGGQVPADISDADRFQVIYPRLAERAVETIGERARFDVLIVDEGQDLLLPAYVDMMDAVVSGGLERGIWRMFLDPRQNVYGSIPPQGIGRLSEGHPAEGRLQVNCRNTSPIAVETALLSARTVDEVLSADGPEVDVQWYSTDEDQSKLVASKVRKLLGGGILPHEIALLSPFVRDGSGGLAYSNSFGVAVHDISEGGARQGQVIFSTIAGFKGLEADAVILMDGRAISDRVSTGYYVGASRARALLTVFLQDDTRSEYSSAAREFGRREAQRISEEQVPGAR
jgi:hypothetical protein